MTAATLTEIRFYGHLRPVFGKRLYLDVQSPAEALRGLCAVLPGFQQYMVKHSAPGYRVVVGKSPLHSQDEVGHPSGRQTIKIVPAVAGRAGIGKVILGAALVFASFYLPVTPFIGTLSFSGLAMNFGVSMLLGGVSELIAGTPQSSSPSERPNNAPSYAFNGAVNTTAQGNPVPVCYGRLRVGSQVISAGLEAASL